MIFTAKTQDFAEVISRAAAALPSRPSQDIYHRLLLETGDDDLHVVASDGDMMLRVRGECKPESPGKCLVPGRLLADISKYFSAPEIHAEHQGSELLITSGRGRFSLPAGDAAEYPVWAEPPPAVFLHLDGGELAAAIRKVLPAAGDNPVVLSAICIDIEDDHLVLVTTDHSRMAVAELPFTLALPDALADDPPFPPVLLPGGHAGQLARNLEGEVSLGWSENTLSAAYDGGEMTMRLTQGEYLPWRSVLNKEPEYTGITSDTKELARATRMAQLAAGQDNRISWTFRDHEVAVTADREGRECAEYVPVTYEGPQQVTFLLGAQHVLDGLAGCDGAVDMAFTQPPAPLFLRSGSYKYMLQPRREL